MNQRHFVKFKRSKYNDFVNEFNADNKSFCYTKPMHFVSFQEGGASPTKLQRTDVKLSSHEYCNRVNSDAGYPVYDSHHICAHDPDVKTGPCHVRYFHFPRQRKEKKNSKESSMRYQKNLKDKNSRFLSWNLFGHQIFWYRVTSFCSFEKQRNDDASFRFLHFRVIRVVHWS